MKLWVMKTYYLVFIAFLFLCTNSYAEENRKVVIAVAPNLVLALDDEIKTYVSDLTLEGWSVEVNYPSYSDLFNLGELLKRWNDEFNMKGVVLIGSFPYSDEVSLANINPFFNSFLGRGVDFWISRIDPKLLTFQQREKTTFFMKKYFEKNHRYRSHNKYNDKVNIFHQYSYSFQFLNFLFSLGFTEIFTIYDNDDFFDKTRINESMISELLFHGNKILIETSDNADLNADQLLVKFNSKSKLIDLQACYGGAPEPGNIASALLFSPNSRVLAVLARPGVAWVPSSLANRQHSHYEKTAGEVFISHSLSWFYIYETTIHYLHNYFHNSYDSRVLFGDGTLRLE